MEHLRVGETSVSKHKNMLTEEQETKNAEILARLESERRQLVEETRALQQQERRRPGRKRRKKAVDDCVVELEQA